MIHTVFLDSRDVHALSDDIQSMLDADGSALELSPAFRRLLFDVDEVLTAVACNNWPQVVTVAEGLARSPSGSDAPDAGWREGRCGRS